MIILTDYLKSKKLIKRTLATIKIKLNRLRENLIELLHKFVKQHTPWLVQTFQISVNQSLKTRLVVAEFPSLPNFIWARVVCWVPVVDPENTPESNTGTHPLSPAINAWVNVVCEG